MNIKVMSTHILIDNCEKVFSCWYTVIQRARLPKNNVRLHTLSVWLHDLRDPFPPTASPTHTESLLHHSTVDPHSSGPTPLIWSASFSYRMQMHVTSPARLPLFQFPLHQRKWDASRLFLTNLKLWETMLHRRSLSVPTSGSVSEAKKSDLVEANYCVRMLRLS